MRPRSSNVTKLVASDQQLAAAASRLAEHDTIAIDIESNGLFKYKATLCTLQIASPSEIVIVDALSVRLGPLRDALGPSGPKKVIHDIAFDARILTEAGILLGNVFDTSIAARMLGRTATGLASLLGELGVTVDKKLQHHDWTERPITAEQLRYLSDDVAHLTDLADKLSAELRERGIEEAVEEETRYRLAQAIASIEVVDRRPPYVRLKGVDRVPEADLPILRRLAELREAKAREIDVPPYKVLAPDVLFAIARAKPRTLDELAQVKGATSGQRARSMAAAMLEAVAGGLADVEIPREERAMLERPRLPPAIAKARRAREASLTAWRRATAKTRAVDEQVVLPGHCLQDLADLDASKLDDEQLTQAITGVKGVGAFRVARDGEAIREALRRTKGAAEGDRSEDPS